MSRPSVLLQAAEAAAGTQQYPAATLYVVATPIGNLADLTLRAIHVLWKVDAVACEDTRHTSPLLRHLGLDKPLIALHEHNEREASATVLARLAAGERVAYVSDAGTPAVSDPGAALVAACQAAGHRTVPIPGASSALAALCVAGDTVARSFSFIGFLPPKGNERQQALQALSGADGTQVLFEAPHRIAALLQGLADVLPDRRVTVCRELTKQFESVETMPAAQLPGWLAADANRSRGEFAIVVHARAEAATDDDAAAHDRTLQPLMAALPLKQAVALAAELTGAPRNALYARALELKAEADDAG